MVFRAPRYDERERKIENARITVIYNGKLIHRDVELPRATEGWGPEEPPVGPIILQDYGSPVRYRNIWLVEK